MTDKEIIEALALCENNKDNCGDCPKSNECFHNNMSFIGDGLDLINRQQAEINKLKSMSNWISVKEKLPPKNTAVLCLIKYAEPDRWYTYALLTLHNGKWEQFWDNRLLHPEYQVTHWQTLPEPPKGDDTNAD